MRHCPLKKIEDTRVCSSEYFKYLDISRTLGNFKNTCYPWILKEVFPIKATFGLVSLLLEKFGEQMR